MRRRPERERWPVLHGFSTALVERPADWRAGLDARRAGLDARRAGLDARPAGPVRRRKWAVRTMPGGSSRAMLETAAGAAPGGREEVVAMRTRPKQHGNPLRRGSDRVQWWLGRALLLAAVLALPAAAVAGLATYRSHVRVAEAEAATRQPVAARLATDAPPADSDVPSRVPATAAWTTADGTTRTASVRVWPGERAGSPVTVWLDARGTVVPAPATRGDAAASAWITALVVSTSVPLACLAGWRSAVLLLDRRRLARWDEEWNLVEPHWTRRLPS